MNYSNKRSQNGRIGTLCKVHDLDITDPIDMRTAIDSLGGNRKLYISMLEKIEVMSLSGSLF